MVIPAAESEAIRQGRAALGAQGAIPATVVGGHSITIYNPQPRAAETDIARTMRRLAALG
jgi:hypothetical protein